MNTFIVCWNLERKKHELALCELQRMIRIFPELDPKTFWHVKSPCGTLLAGSIHTAEQIAAPRQYVSKSPDVTIFYSGLPIAPSNAFLAHRAEELSTHWNGLEHHIEGSYFIARLGNAIAGVEFINDCFGLEQVYYHRNGDSIVFSNSVYLIEKVIGSQPLDHFGTSLYLTLGSAGMEKTLRKGIKAVPGGQKWCISQQGIHVYNRPDSFQATLPQISANNHHSDSGNTENLADQMLKLCRAVNANFKHVESNLTGGKDSRIVLSLLLNASVNQEITYNTIGNPNSKDVIIARQLSEICEIPHEVKPITTGDIINRWDDIWAKYIRQNDGMSSLWQIGDVLEFPERLSRLITSYCGAGGEVARSYFLKPEHVLRLRSYDKVRRHLIEKHSMDDEGLILEDTKNCMEDYLTAFIHQSADMGFKPQDIPDWYFTIHDIGRWSGSNARRGAPVKDLISPFCTRAFIEATFSMPTIQRMTEPLHFRLIKKLSPQLHGIPFDRAGWKYQNAALNMVQSWANHFIKTGKGHLKKKVKALYQNYHRSDNWRQKATIQKAFCQYEWLEAKRKEILDLCMSSCTESIWSMIDRSVLEKALYEDEQSAYRQKFALRLLKVATLLYYEKDHNAQKQGQATVSLKGSGKNSDELGHV